MTYFYIACFVISFLLMIFVVVSGSSRSINQSLLLAATTMANGGYLALAISKNVEEALLAQKLIYAGGEFLPMIFFLVVCEVCRFKVPRPVCAAMYAVQTFIYLMVCTAGYRDYYYVDVQYHSENGITYLTKIYGPMHKIHLVAISAYMLAVIIVLIYSIGRKNKVSFKNMVVMLLAMVISTLTYMIELIFHSKTEIMPIVYLLLVVTETYVVYKASVYMVDGPRLRQFQELSRVAYVCFNRKLSYMSCNDVAVNIFPELSRYNVDFPVPEDGSTFSDKLMVRIKNQVAKREDPFGDGVGTKDREIMRLGESYYEYRLDPILDEYKIWKGYILILTDMTDHQKYLNMIEGYNRNLEREVQGKTQRIREIQERTILGMAQMVESRDLSTGGHIKRTSSVVSVFSKALMKTGYITNQQFLNYVVRSAPMHDLGKIAVDDQILRKQGTFTAEEYEKMKTHSAEGARIVSRILTGIEEPQFVEIATNVAHYHHEKVNGKGYPEGLVGDDIPVEARIMALADVFDALVSKRCYKEAFTFDKAFSIIEEDAGSHFDEELAKIFISCRPELEALYKSFEEDEEEGV